MSSRGAGKKFAVGALVAGVVGFLVGILSAPKSGKETREDLKDTTKIAISRVEKDLKIAHTELKDSISSVSSNLKTTSLQAKSDLKKALDKAKKSQAKVRVALSSIHDGKSDDPELKLALKEAKSAKEHLRKFLKKT